MPGTVDADYASDGLVEYILSKRYSLEMDGSFVCIHNASWRKIKDVLTRYADIQPFVFSTIRDPTDRMSSALHYLYRTSSRDIE